MKNKALLFLLVLSSPLLSKALPTINLLPEFRTIGGGNNNLAHPGLNPVPGSSELNLAPLRFGPANKPQFSNARPSSNIIFGGGNVPGTPDPGQALDPSASDWLYVMGQFVDHDLDLEDPSTNNASIPVPIPQPDPVFPPTQLKLPLNRATRDPVTNNIVNTVAGFLDLSQTYGSDQANADFLRNPDGTLVTTGSGQFLPILDGFFVSGDVRVMENPELTAVTTLFMRNHNYWVGVLRGQHPDWSGDQLYNMARALNIAEFQHVLYTEYIPLLLGPIPAYADYNPEVDSRITQEFSTAAFRLHTQIGDTQAGITNQGAIVFSESLSDSFFNTPAQDELNGIDALLRGLGTFHAQATDSFAVSQLRNLLFDPPVDALDLIAIDIWREGDVGLQLLNGTRSALGLAPYASFAELTPDPALQAALAKVFPAGIDAVDLFTGGNIESHVNGGLVGQTFSVILIDQFTRLRDGDRFWWENEPWAPAVREMISHTALADILARNTDTPKSRGNLFIADSIHRNPVIHAPPVRRTGTLNKLIRQGD